MIDFHIRPYDGVVVSPGVRPSLGKMIALDIRGDGTPAEVMELAFRLIDAARREGVMFNNRTPDARVID